MSSKKYKPGGRNVHIWNEKEHYAKAWKQEAKLQEAISDADGVLGKPLIPHAGGGGGSGEFAGTASVGLAGLFKLIKRTARPETPIRPYLISRAVYRIQPLKSHCKATVRYEVRVLSDDWLTIPLLSKQVALTSSSVNISTSTASPFVFPPPVAPQPPSTDLKRHDSISSQASARISSAASELGEPHVELEGMNYNDPFATIAMTEGTSDPKHALMTNHKGEYIVELELLAPYTSTREMGMTLNIPEASQNELTFEISRSNLDIKVEPCLSTIKTINDGERGTKTTSIVCQIPPTSFLSIQWTEKIVELERVEVQVVKAPLPLIVTCEQSTLHSVGEGILTTSCHYAYKIMNGSITSIEIQIDSRVRILNVNGRAIKRYDVVEGSGDKKGKEDGMDHKHYKKDSTRILKVSLEYGIEELYELTIYSELDMGGTSSKVQIPVFRNLGLVSREKGFIGIEARTNVEVEFLEGDGIQPVDTSELPKPVWDAAGQSILLGYKYLDPSISILLEVKKHEDVGVLIAVIEDAHIVMTQTAEGRLLTKVALKVRNTQKQFLRIRTPAKANIWSTAVAGKPVKPARDVNGLLMLPMQKSSGSASSDGSATSFRAELVYFLEQDKPMGPRGEVAFEIPQMDIPCSNLLVSLYIPMDYNYGEWAGSLKEVEYHSRTPLDVTSSYAQTNYQVKQQYAYNYASNWTQEIEQAYDIVPVREVLDGHTSFASKARNAAPRKQKLEKAGVLPVQVDIPTEGKLVRFEQMLVNQNSKLDIRVTYTQTARKGCRERRRVNKCCCIIL